PYELVLGEMISKIAMQMAPQVQRLSLRLLAFPYKDALIEAIVSPHSASKNIVSLDIEGVQLGLADLFMILKHLPSIKELRIEPDLEEDYTAQAVPAFEDEDEEEDEDYDNLSLEPKDYLALNLKYLSVMGKCYADTMNLITFGARVAARCPKLSFCDMTG
ncbi:hypothetical protein GGI16_005877, partial [Coemansia sp. S142-1]